jgi:glycerate kinase
MRADTRGVGHLLLEAASAMDQGDRLIVGLGGSATVDAGAGMVTELGWELLDGDGDPIPPGGAGLQQLATIVPPAEPPDLPPLLVLADVANPLLGRRGAARVFAPQKGATEQGVERLERALKRWAHVVAEQLGRDVADLPGAGAAGGLGAAFAAFLDAPPQRGADWVLDTVGFDPLLDRADIVVTGEGKWDAQSPMGKVTGEVVRRCRHAKVPVLMVTGTAEDEVPQGVTVVTGPPDGLDEAGIQEAVAKALPGLLARHRRP